MTRKIQWLSALEVKNNSILNELQKKMQNYYSDNRDYYSDISFTEKIWNDNNSLIHRDIINECRNKSRILEIGCGQAFILRTGKIKKENYTGIDYSSDLIEKNRTEYPESIFLPIKQTNIFPVLSESFELVFSHFVIEHTVFPNIFLDECFRVLKPNGTLIIVAPNFLSRNLLTSQKAGFSKGSGREKFKNGKYFDMLVTGFDSRIKIPLVSLMCRYLANKKPKFFVNINPTCFIYEFSPDLDAVYLTYEKEIKAYLNHKIDWSFFDDELNRFVVKNNIIYIKGLKRF
jgi:2-polyprenyl-3-methyl-5-hydroxy-6-metoxy-1,4-benzoquinol methylase